MKIIITGKAGKLREVLVDRIKEQGHEVVLVPNRNRWPDGKYDLCVDSGAGGMGDVKQVMTGLKGRVRHYVQLSSYKVYPSVPRYSPWRPEDIDLNDESGLEPLELEIRGKRAAERELRIRGLKGIPWTILRPGIVEIKKNPDPQHMWWYASRILDDGPIILPDSDDPMFRHVSGDDLVQAVLAIACREIAFSQTLNVVSNAILSHETYARLLMKVMGKEVGLLRVPDYRWRAAGLTLPMGNNIESAFLSDSQTLKNLGWKPTEEEEWVAEYAQHLVANPLSSFAQRKAEIGLAEESRISVQHAQIHATDGWRLVGEQGQPNSVRVDYGKETLDKRMPILKTIRVAMNIADEDYLIGGGSRKLAHILGQNVLLQLVDSADSGLAVGTKYIPVAGSPCGNLECPWCASHQIGTAGVDYDGYAADYINLPAEHLLPVSEQLTDFALLAHPLSILLSVLPAMLAETRGSVWIFGRRVEAVMAGFLVDEAEGELVHIDRGTTGNVLLAENISYMDIEKAHKRVRQKEMESPELVVNLSGARDGENLLAGAVKRGGMLASPFVATGTHSRRLNINLPMTAPGRLWLEKAMEKIEEWRRSRDLQSLVRFVSLDEFHECFLQDRFRQTAVDITGEKQ